MRSSRTFPKLFTLLVGAAALLYSCSDGIGLLTNDEKQSLYQVEVSARGASIFASSDNQGVILDPSEGVKIAFDTLKGSEEPVELIVTLKEASGGHSISVRYYTADASSDPESDGSVLEQSVPSLASLSQTLAVPSDFPDGYYELLMDARSDRAESLSLSRISLFLIRSSVPIPAILTYPANPSPGSRVLLVANLDGYEGKDPYLRWTVDGVVRSEGTVSEGKRTLLWPAPLAGSAAAVALALYPVAPPAGVAYSFPAPRNASASLLVASGASIAQDEFADPSRFLALFRMEDTPEYAGVSPGTGTFIGTPRLDVHAGGYGLDMGGESGAGIQADTVLLPVRNGKLNPFTILARFAPANPGDGVLFKAVSDMSGPSFEIRLSGSRPVAVLGASGGSEEVKSDVVLPDGRAAFLAVTVFPDGNSLRVSFLVDGNPAGEGTLPLGAEGWSTSGSTIISGPEGCPGLYDEVGVWAFDSNGNPSVYPAYYFASLREFKSDVVVAEDFEGSGGSGIALSGGATISPLEGLVLPAGGSASFEASAKTPFRVEAALSDGDAIVVTVTGSEGTVSIPLSASTGRVDAYSGLTILSVHARASADGVGITLSGGGGDAVQVEGAGPWRVGLRGTESGKAVARRFRVLRAEEIAEDLR